MVKHFFALIVGVCMAYFTLACDACACTSMNTLDGQLLPSNKTFFGSSLGYAHQLDASKSKINNLSYNVFIAYSFAKRFQIMANMPFQHTITNYKNGDRKAQIGLGDATLLFSFMAYSTPSKKNKTSKSTFILRTGVKFPTGYYDNTGSDFNLGTKSYDVLLASQYIFEKENQGFNASLNSRINTTNQYNYKYGHQFNLSIFYFLKRDFKKNSYMPFAGVSYEHITKDKSNGYIRNLTGGTGLYGFGGLQWNYNNKFSFYLKGEMPFIQNYLSTDGKIYTNFKGQFQINYFIKTKQKIKKSIKL